MFQFSVLASGSKANCTLVKTENTCFLIDCGLSSRECQRRIRELGIDPAHVQAILLTHEHRDHVFGVPVLSRQLDIPVFANQATARVIPRVNAVETFETGQEFNIGDISIRPFSIPHDAIEPVGFRLSAHGLVYAQATDLGRVTPLVTAAVRGAHALLLESNHDPDMLWSCGYPWELKQRISSQHGHLSNNSSSALLYETAHSDLRHVVLGHISENSNTPALALAEAARASEHISLASLRCANPYQATPLMDIAAESSSSSILRASNGC
ncbi:MAG: MBL fold metallo-hydrolase [Oligoflexia bacterium]|nr:MBL fold metallo-hydrolase [Oligoflexia bacterium]